MSSSLTYCFDSTGNLYVNGRQFDIENSNKVAFAKLFDKPEFDKNVKIVPDDLKLTTYSLNLYDFLNESSNDTGLWNLLKQMTDSKSKNTQQSHEYYHDRDDDSNCGDNGTDECTSIGDDEFDDDRDEHFEFYSNKTANIEVYESCDKENFPLHETILFNNDQLCFYSKSISKLNLMPLYYVIIDMDKDVLYVKVAGHSMTHINIVDALDDCES